MTCTPESRRQHQHSDQAATRRRGRALVTNRARARSTVWVPRRLAECYPRFREISDLAITTRRFTSMHRHRRFRSPAAVAAIGFAGASRTEGRGPKFVVAVGGGGTGMSDHGH